MILSSSILVFALAAGPIGAVAPIEASPAPAPPSLAALSRLDLAPALIGQSTSPQDWQRQYDVAKARRKSGLKKVVIGLAMEGGGIAMALAGATTCSVTSVNNDCSGSGSVAAIGVLTSLAGAVPFWWGVIQWLGANSDVHSLEATKPAGTAAHSIGLTDHQAIQLSAGRRSGVGYKLSW